MVSVGVVNADNEAAEGRIVAAAGQGAAGVELPYHRGPVRSASPAAAALGPAEDDGRRSDRPTDHRGTPGHDDHDGATGFGHADERRSSRRVCRRCRTAIQWIVVKVNDRTFTLASNQQVGPVSVIRYAHGNDIVEVDLSPHPGCATDDADNYSPAPGNYQSRWRGRWWAPGVRAACEGSGFAVRRE